MKKFLKATFVIASSFALFMPFVSADEEIYYTNLNGATLTMEQYEILVDEFGEDTIATMSPYQIDCVRDVTEFETQTVEKYIRTDIYFDRDGGLIGSYDTEISENEALNFNPITYQPFAASVTHTTNAKKLTLSMRTGSGPSVKIATIKNTWITIPSVKSFDVIALRPGGVNTTVGSVSIDGQGYSGYQKYDNSIINYPVGNGNYKFVGSLNGNGGVGLSQNIVDSTSYFLENSMTVTFINGGQQFLLYGTYQHATSSVTLAQSQNYSIHYSGLGNVLLFNNGIGIYYDGMAGVQLLYQNGDETQV